MPRASSPHVDAALHGGAEGLDRIGLGDEVGVLDPHALAARSRSRCGAGSSPPAPSSRASRTAVRHDVAGGLQAREKSSPTNSSPVSPAQFSLKAPCTAVDDGPAQVHATSANAPVLGVAQPVVDDAVAADEGLAAVDDDDLAVVAVVHHADVGQDALVEDATWQPASRICSLPFAGLLGALRVEHHAHLHAGARRGRSGRRPRARPAPVLPQEGLEVHRVLGGPDVLQHASKKAPFSRISTAFSRIAMPSGMPAIEGISSSSRFCLRLEVRVLVALDRPDGHAGDCDGEHQHGVDPGHGGEC